MNEKNTLVLGASLNPNRYSHSAVQKLNACKHKVYAIGNRPGKIDDIEIFTERKTIENIHTVTLYINAENQKSYYDYILSLQPKRIIFNPGTENRELAELARKNGVNPMNACTLVMLSTGQF